MKISTKGRYSLALLIEIEKNKDKDKDKDKEYTSIKIISENLNLSMKYLEKIANILVKNKLLDVSRGKQGGYKLVKSINEYTVGEVLRLTEKNMETTKCISNTNECKLNPECKKYLIFKGLDDAISNYLDNINLNELV